MLRTMKQKALALDATARSSSKAAEGESTETATTTEEASSTKVNGESASTSGSIPSTEGQGPKYKAMVNALQVLKPTSLELVDNSHQHAGHAGNDMDSESHFELSIVADAFEGLNLVKRHQLIYMVLGDMMQQIHALQIQSLTPAEAEQRGL